MFSRSGKTLVKRTPDHHGDDLVHIQPFQRLGGDPLAVAQDGYFIAQLENFFHFMRDIDDTAAAIFQLTDDLKQMVDLFFSVSDDVGSSMMTILAS